MCNPSPKCVDFLLPCLDIISCNPSCLLRLHSKQQGIQAGFVDNRNCLYTAARVYLRPLLVFRVNMPHCTVPVSFSEIPANISRNEPRFPVFISVNADFFFVEVKNIEFFCHFICLSSFEFGIFARFFRKRTNIPNFFLPPERVNLRCIPLSWKQLPSLKEWLPHACGVLPESIHLRA